MSFVCVLFQYFILKFANIQKELQTKPPVHCKLEHSRPASGYPPPSSCCTGCASARGEADCEAAGRPRPRRACRSCSRSCGTPERRDKRRRLEMSPPRPFFAQRHYSRKRLHLWENIHLVQHVHACVHVQNTGLKICME